MCDEISHVDRGQGHYAVPFEKLWSLCYMQLLKVFLTFLDCSATKSAVKHSSEETQFSYYDSSFPCSFFF